LADRWAAEQDRAISYLGFEPYPLAGSTVAGLHFPDLPAPSAERLSWLHAGLASSHGTQPHYRTVAGSQPARQFAVLPIAVESWVDEGQRFHVVFHDAFSPDRDPGPWSGAVMERLFHLLHPGGALVTYCAKGIIRRRLQDLGFVVERLPGPPGKREMLRAWRPSMQSTAESE
jgi:tRNA U34 5-methylaminomethyl-2-thiouridine-forming methyltransferase MnmC